MNLLQDRMAYIYEHYLPRLEGKNGQISLVKVTGADKSQVNQWISGAQQSIRIEHALLIEAAFGFSHIWLMTGVGDPIAKPGQVIILGPSNPVEQPRMTLALPEELDLLDLFRRSTERGAQGIIDAANASEKKPAAKIRRNKG